MQASEQPGMLNLLWKLTTSNRSKKYEKETKGLLNTDGALIKDSRLTARYMTTTPHQKLFLKDLPSDILKYMIKEFVGDITQKTTPIRYTNDLDDCVFKLPNLGSILDQYWMLTAEDQAIMNNENLGNILIAKHLFLHQDELNEVEAGIAGDTLAHYYANNPKMLTAIKRAGGSLDIQNNCGKTALAKAVESKDFEKIDNLLKRGADVNALSRNRYHSYDYTPLDEAALSLTLATRKNKELFYQCLNDVEDVKDLESCQTIYDTLQRAGGHRKVKYTIELF